MARVKAVAHSDLYVMIFCNNNKLLTTHYMYSNMQSHSQTGLGMRQLNTWAFGRVRKYPVLSTLSTIYFVKTVDKTILKALLLVILSAD